MSLPFRAPAWTTTTSQVTILFQEPCRAAALERALPLPTWTQKEREEARLEGNSLAGERTPQDTLLCPGQLSAG